MLAAWRTHKDPCFANGRPVFIPKHFLCAGDGSAASLNQKEIHRCVKRPLDWR